MIKTILAFLLLIGPLIFVHELGHLLAAKLVDVKVTRFSIGFGKPLFKVQFGETEYCVAPFLLGGYVRLLGQNPHEEMEDADKGRALHQKPLWARYLVLAAGPIANFILPLIIFFFASLGQTTQLPPVVGTVIDDSPAAMAELEAGDRIVAVDGKDITAFRDLQSAIGDHYDEELKIEIERDGKRFERYVTPRKGVSRNLLGMPEPRGLLGITARFYGPQIGIIDPDSPAYQEGLRTGDVITSVNGEPVATIEQLERLLEVSGDKALRLTYLRATKTQGPLGASYLFYDSNHARLLPRASSDSPTGILAANTFLADVEEGSPAEQAGLRPGSRILAVDDQPLTRFETLTQVLSRRGETGVVLTVQDFGSEITREVPFTLGERTFTDVYKNQHTTTWFGAIPYAFSFAPELEPIRGRFTFAAREAVSDCTQLIGAMWVALRQMVTLERSVDELSSVVGMASAAGIAADRGAGEFVMLMAIISLNLGFVNLLPIPNLDGGHILFYTVESVRGKPLGQRAREIISVIGLVIILLLLLVALRNDIMRFWIN